MDAAQYVYVLCCYGEYGLESPIVATLERDKLLSLIPDEEAEHSQALIALLERSDAELSGTNGMDTCDGQTGLSDRWGGLQLMVLRLN